MLNHKLVASYIEYLTAVRKSSPGTIGEALTAAISACRWLYRKERAAPEPLVIRRYKDWRNEYQAKAARMRAQDDADELQERGKWISWSEFTDTVQRLRREWKASLEDDDGARVTVQSSRQLHDVLLPGLYACIPGRGAEVRLLQYWSDEDLQQHRKGGLTMKKCVERHEANIVARSEGGGVWKMWVLQFKNARFHGVDCTELTTDNFGWWIDLLEQYLEQGYRAKLLKPNATHKYLFVTRSGEPFSQSYFSDFISSLLLKHTGKASGHQCAALVICDGILCVRRFKGPATASVCGQRDAALSQAGAGHLRSQECIESQASRAGAAGRPGNGGYERRRSQEDCSCVRTVESQWWCSGAIDRFKWCAPMQTSIYWLPCNVWQQATPLCTRCL